MEKDLEASDRLKRKLKELNIKLDTSEETEKEKSND